MNPLSTHTKIIATLGPTSASRDVMTRMIDEGVNVFRLNFSHSTQEEHLKSIHLIQELNKERGTRIAILADLQGPKLRIGEVEGEGIDLKNGDIVTFVTQKCTGTKKHLFINYADFPKDVSPDEIIFLDDGKIKLKVNETNKKDSVTAQVINGGLLTSNKGINLPNTQISSSSLTEADISNARFALKNGVDWIALSFVRSAKDILDLKNLFLELNSFAKIIAKIEKPEALKEIDKIIQLADGIMVARGDLGVEVPFDQVPLIQKLLVKKCLAASKPVIIATQMMESMITAFRPTRAEANDVANAVLDGADALMLSGETAVGKYPAETIRNMHAIIEYTEANGMPFYFQHDPSETSTNYLADSICNSAAKLADQLKAKIIVVFTHSGYTALRIAGHRPKAPVFAFTDNIKIANRLSLVWGVHPRVIKLCDTLDEAIFLSSQMLKKNGVLQEGDTLVQVGSIPIKQQGMTNVIKVEKV